MTKTYREIVKTYAKLAKKLGVYPTRADLKLRGISRDKIRHYFTNLDGLRDVARHSYPEMFTGVIDEVLFSKIRKAALDADLKKYQRFVISTVVGGASMHKGFYKAIQQYCKLNNAKLLLLYAEDAGSDNQSIFDPTLMANEHIVLQDVALNSNIFISAIKLSAKQVDPVTGLARLGQREGTFVYASPKQRLKAVPTSNTKMPHIIVTTGAITKPSYVPKSYSNSRTSYLANFDHVNGALIVEIEDNKYYHMRHVQADKSGGFADLGRYYNSTGRKMYPPEAFVLGDTHVGETDPTAEKAWEEVFKYTKCKYVILHDMFDGTAINRHEQDNQIIRAQLANNNQLSLLEEFKANAEFLNKWTTLAKKVVVVASNHHDFLAKYYIPLGMYHKDPQNFQIGVKLADSMVDGHDPLRFAIENLIGLKRPKSVIWLSRDEDYKVSGIELGAHGDVGSNGSRGNLAAMETAYSNSVSGHSHTPEILRGAWQVGTSTYLKLRYNRGASSWMNASCLVYSNGARQMIFSISGKWHLKDK